MLHSLVLSSAGLYACSPGSDVLAASYNANPSALGRLCLIFWGPARSGLAACKTLASGLILCVLVQPDGWARGEREGYGGPCDVTSLSLSLSGIGILRARYAVERTPSTRKGQQRIPRKIK